MPGAPAPMREERRIVTALFADIVGSTTLTEQLDPEDARDIVGGAVALAIEQVDALGGTIKDLAGDGVLALFGAPLAHEDDAERAVLCGLRIVDAVADHASDVADRLGVRGLSVRVGIETGRVVMGAIGAGSRVEYGATGDVINTAARLQALAEPGRVLVGAATRSMLDETFVWGPGRSYELKGKVAPVEAATAVSYTPRRVATTVRSTSLVGRLDLLIRLKEVLARVAAGTGCVVALVGPAGVGKTRLTSEARQMFTELDVGMWVEVGAASYESDVPYLLYRHLFMSWLGLPFSAGRDEVRAAAAARADAAVGDQALALAALPSMTASALDTGDPIAVQERVFAGVRDLVAAFVEQAPAALVLEDLHWSDATSLAVTADLARLTANAPLLILVTTRPNPAVESMLERLDDATGGGLVRFDVGPLPPDAGRELLAQLTRGTELPQDLEERLLATMDGNPFFAHEQVRALIASGALARDGDRLRFTGDDDVTLAPTVERALVARIDRLGESERDVLLAASVLGPDFARATLEDLVGRGLSAELGHLEETDFLVPVATTSDSIQFRHALVQEAAYSSLLKRQRRQLHGRAAAVLEHEYAGREIEVAAVIGRHLANAGDSSRAAGYLLEAARSTLAAYSNDEAADLAASALSLLDSVGETTGERVVELLSIEGSAAGAQARHDDAVAAYRRILELLPDGDARRRARIRCEIGVGLQLSHRYESALDELRLAEADAGDPRSDPEAFDVWLDIVMARGEVYYWLADHDSFSALLASAEPVVIECADPEQKLRYYHAVRSAAWRKSAWVITDEMLSLDTALFEAQLESDDESDRAWAKFQHGFTLLWHRDLREGAELLREALDAAERLGAVVLKARCLAYLMVCARLDVDSTTAARMIPDVVQAAREADLPEYEALALATSGWVALGRRAPERVVADASAALEAWRSIPNRYAFDWMACLPLLRVALDRDDLEAAAAAVRPMLAEGQQPLPEAVTVGFTRGLAAVAAGDPATAAAAFTAALGEARAARLI